LTASAKSAVDRKARLIHKVVKQPRELLSGRRHQNWWWCELGEGSIPTNCVVTPGRINDANTLEGDSANRRVMGDTAASHFLPIGLSPLGA
jgi:hypothetical protein